MLFKIPTYFTIHNHLIKVIKKEIDDKEENRFGYYDCVKEEIVIFEKVRSDGEPHILSEVQLECSFLHELIHCLQWHVKGMTNEQDAQSYAGLILEFIKSNDN